jgi:hypothetical protein
MREFITIRGPFNIAWRSALSAMLRRMANCAASWSPRSDQLRFTTAALPPQISTPTRSFSAGTCRPEVRAASAAAPPGSATMRSVDHSRRCASKMDSSVTNTVLPT